MKKVKQIIRNILDVISPSILYRNISCSQDGEDMILRSFFESEGKVYKGFYVDIGAHHPYRFSNTAYFYNKGWSGINVEPTPSLIKAFNRARKRDINLNIAAGESEKPLKFHIFNETALNSFDEEVSKSRENGKYIMKDIIEIKQHTLSEILNKYLPVGQKIDFLTIDVEGLDFSVLKSNNWEKYSPEYILVESFFNYEKTKEDVISMYLKDKDYMLIARTLRTSIYKKQKI